jgi:hypothetical protein
MMIEDFDVKILNFPEPALMLLVLPEYMLTDGTFLAKGYSWCGSYITQKQKI